jgi:hypothetical protein
MAIEQKVVIRVEIDPDMTKAAAVNAFLSTLDKRLGKTNKKLNKTSDLLKDGVAFHLGRAARKMADFGKAILKVNFKGLIVELGLVTIGLVAMKGALAAGRGIMRGWNSTVSFLKVTTAGFTASIVALVSALMAANRQFQQTQLSPFIGGMQNAREAMGALRSESLAPMGVQNITATAAMLSRAGLDTRRQAAVMREMANISSGDPKAFQAMSQAVAAVQSSGSTKAGVAALQGLGPMFKDVAGKAGSMSADEFIKAMGSGKLTPEAFQGQMDKINQTLMGGFKGMVTKLYVALADMGMIFLDPLRNALAQVEHIFLRSLHRVTGTINAYGLETFVPKLVSGVERFTNWWVKLIVNDLPRLMEVYGNIADWWRSFTAGTSQWFGNLGAAMDKFKESGDAAWQFWKNIFGEIGKFMGGRFNEYDKDIKKQRQEFEMFGTSLGRVIAGILGVVTAFKDEFMEMLPELNEFFAFLTIDVFPVMQDFAEQFAQAFKSALPVIRNIVSAFLPMLILMNKLIGVIGGSSGMGGLGILFAGWLAMTQGGRGMMHWTRQGMIGGAAPTGGQGAISYKMGQRMAGSSAGGFFATRNAARAAGGGFFGSFKGARAGSAASRAAARAALPPGVAGPVLPAKTAWSPTRGMGMGTMIAGMLLAQTVGGVVGGDTGQAIASAGTMAAMGSMMGLSGALGMGALAMGSTAWKARTEKGGAMAGAISGGMGGASAGAMIGTMIGGPGLGTAAGLIVGAVVGTIAGHVLGSWRGRDNEERLAEAGRELASELVRTIVDAMKVGSRGDITNRMTEFDELLADDAKLTDMARQAGVSKKAFTDEMNWRRLKLIYEVVPDLLNKIGISAATLGEITGETALEIEDNAKRWGIALQAGGQAVDDYIYQRNIRFKHTTAAEIDSMISGATYDTLMDSPMHIEHRKNVLGLESKAATDTLFTSMQSGDIDMDALNAYLSTGIAEMAASGMSASEQNAAIGRVLANMGTNATKWGFGGEIQGAIRQVQSNYGVTPGGTGQGFVDTTFKKFKENDFYAQNLTEMSGRLYGEGESMDQDKFDADMKAMFEASDAGEQLAVFNQILWSVEADAIVKHKNLMDLDSEALEIHRLALLANAALPLGDDTLPPPATTGDDAAERGSDLTDLEAWLKMDLYDSLEGGGGGGGGLI